MKTNSLTARKENIESGRNCSQKEQILRLITAYEGLTRKSIANKLQMEYSTVSGRVNDLLKEGKIREGFNEPEKRGGAKLYINLQLSMNYAPRNKRYKRFYDKAKEVLPEHYLQLINNAI